MGIGNDIKPKKVYRYKATQHHETYSHRNTPSKEQHEFKPKSSSMEERDPDKVEEIEDDFFHDYNKSVPKKEKEERPADGFLFQNLSAKNITWLLVLALIVIVVYQNFDSIKGLVIKDNGAVSNTNNDEYYEGVTNTNSIVANANTNANSNVNANTNANANTNTATAETAAKAAIKLRALNGNGVAGSADAVAATLKTAGFAPAKSGNANKFTYASSIIYYKTGEEDSANLVKAALPNLATTLTPSDSITGIYDVLVVVGKE